MGGVSEPVKLPTGWMWASLADLLTSIETGKSFKCEERPPQAEEVGVVKVSAVSWGEYREQESKTCLDEQRINPDLFVKSGDFLFSRANTQELVGACVIAGKTSLRVMLSDKILRFNFAKEAMKPWLLRRASALGHHMGSSPSTRTRSSSDHAVALRFMRKLILPFFPIGTGRTKFSTIFFNNDRFCGA